MMGVVFTVLAGAISRHFLSCCRRTFETRATHRFFSCVVDISHHRFSHISANFSWLSFALSGIIFTHSSSANKEEWVASVFLTMETDTSQKLFVCDFLNYKLFILPCSCSESAFWFAFHNQGNTFLTNFNLLLMNALHSVLYGNPYKFVFLSEKKTLVFTSSSTRKTNMKGRNKDEL